VMDTRWAQSMAPEIGTCSALGNGAE
jgi:hypothetical protein